MSRAEPTFVGAVASVRGGVVTVQLREDMPSTLTLVDGESFRIGQVGAFFRIPLGYVQLYAVCTQVGAAAVEPPGTATPTPVVELPGSGRWLTLVLFGESTGKRFERGVGSYPTVGDEVHLVLQKDLRLIYGEAASGCTITIGSVAAAESLPGRLDLGRLVSRHCAIVGSTGAGKSNLVSVVLEAISSQGFPSARVLVIDPHGEYASAVGDHGYVYRVNPNLARGDRPLEVPFWALPFEALCELTLGGLQPHIEAVVRDQVLTLKRLGVKALAAPPEAETLTASSPVPFSVKRLWFELDDFERQTFSKSDPQDASTRNVLQSAGDAESLRSNQYPPATAYNSAPYKNKAKRNIERQLELMRSRLGDARYAFLFSPGAAYTPDGDGAVAADLDELIASWVGHDRPVTVMDMSGLPSEILPTVVSTVLRIIYDSLFWAGTLPIGGRSQPLLTIIDEAHLFLPATGTTAAHREVQRTAKEGRKYGVGLMVVTQRPQELDPTILSQCGTVIALRLTNGQDKGVVQGSLPDDLGALGEMLPSLRTGEGLVVGEAVPIPTRMRFHRAARKPEGDDPRMPESWQEARPADSGYALALRRWRAQRHDLDD